MLLEEAGTSSLPIRMAATQVVCTCEHSPGCTLTTCATTENVNVFLKVSNWTAQQSLLIFETACS